MPQHPYLFAVNYNGQLFKLTLYDLKCHLLEEGNRNLNRDPFKKVSTSDTCGWGIRVDQNVYYCVLETDLPVRVKEEAFENERWSIRYGWSKNSLLFTDRWQWSSSNGKQERQKNSIILPSQSWHWEGDWMMDESLETDHEGWQYALDFPATYYKVCSRLMFVRRRKWIRYRKFHSFDKWRKIASEKVMRRNYQKTDPTICVLDSNKPQINLFHDVAVGGNMVQCQAPGYLSVWAITFCGKVYYREGVSRTCPEGTVWGEVNCESWNLLQISASPTGTLWACTWEGHAVVRIGVSHIDPKGLSWQEVDAPAGDELMQVAAGENAVWALSKTKKVYFRSGITKKNVVGDKWVKMFGQFSYITVATNNQVFAISKDCKDIYVRTSVTACELVGKEWKLIEFGSPDSHIGWLCVSTSACLDAKQVEVMMSEKQQVSLHSSFANTYWRCYILAALQKRNTRELQCDDTVDNKKQHLARTKRDNGYVLLENENWIKCRIHLHSISQDGDDSHGFFVSYEQKDKHHEIVLSLKELRCVHQRKIISTRPHILVVQTFTNDKVVISLESETTLKEWSDILYDDDSFADNSSAHKAHIWATTISGRIYSANGCNGDCSDLSKLPWRPVAGYCAKVVSGGEGVTWGLGVDGYCYVYSPTGTYEQKSVEVHYIYENNRWNPIEGFSDRLFPSDRWMWSDATGMLNCAKDKYRLPNKNSRWLEEWRVDYHHQVDNSGWQYAVDFPRTYRSFKGVNDYVRRRRWRRLCQVTSLGPWLKVPTDATVLDISINMHGHACSVWAVSCHGDVMVRSGVTATCPQGTSWEVVLIDIPAQSISIGLNNRVWCAAQDGSCYLRAGFMDNQVLGTHWIHLLKDTEHIKSVSIGCNVVMAIDDQDTLYYRENVSDIYPEGTAWLPLLDNVSSVSVNQNDQVCFVQEGDAKIFKVFPVAQSCEEMLLMDWHSVCIRSLPSTHSNEQHVEIKRNMSTESWLLQQENPRANDESAGSTEENAGRETTDAGIDPYSVDIYSFYRSGENNSAVLQGL